MVVRMILRMTMRMTVIVRKRKRDFYMRTKQTPLFTINTIPHYKQQKTNEEYGIVFKTNGSFGTFTRHLKYKHIKNTSII
tara:strand:- start:116 stop:355 length:240 start_codon:yes stop_codon:yes gene_type:complete